MYKTVKKLGFKCVRYQRKPKISPLNMTKRVQFARSYVHWTHRQWKKVLFSDETSIEIGKIYPRKIWLKPENQMKPGFFLPKKQTFVKKYVKAWATLSYNGVGRMVFIEPGRWNRHTYKRILDENLLREAHSLIGNDFLFQEDGDKVHKAKVCMTWKRKKKVKLLEWPPESCDLSPIENCWSQFKRRLSQRRQPTEKEEFKILASQVWEETSLDVCRALFESMPKRLRAVIKSNGNATRY
jgi:hypothetical protein